MSAGAATGSLRADLAGAAVGLADGALTRAAPGPQRAVAGRAWQLAVRQVVAGLSVVQDRDHGVSLAPSDRTVAAHLYAKPRRTERTPVPEPEIGINVY